MEVLCRGMNPSDEDDTGERSEGMMGSMGISVLGLLLALGQLWSILL